MSSFLVNLFGGGRSAAPNRLPLDDINKALALFCSLPPQDVKSQSQPRIPSSNFKNIGHILKDYEAHIGQAGWSHRPRIYTILRGIGRLDVMPIFVSRDCLDFHLPFTTHTLPQELGDSRPDFINFQEHVLTDAKELEKGINGKHVHFGSSGDEHFFVHSHLGSGGFGYVDHVWSRLSYTHYARKRFHRGNNSRDSQEGYRRFVQEIRALKGLSHRHLVKVIGSYSDQQCYAFLMKPVADCNLLTFLQRIKSNEVPALRSFFGCLTNAIAYLHKRKIQHMDIKPENLLIKNGELYVADFGAAHDWSKKERSTTWSSAPRTPRYIPPEVARDSHSPRNSSTDMWSLGVVFLEMVTVLRGRKIEHLRQYLITHGTKHPFVYANAPATNSWFEVLRTSEVRPDYDNEPLAWVKDLIQPDPLNRPSASGLVRQLLESGSSERFCGFCCSNLADSNWVEPPNPGPNRTYEAVTVIDDDDDFEYGSHRSHLVGPQDGMLPEAKSHSIEAWLNLGEDLSSADPASYGLEPSITEPDELPYEIDDDEFTEVISKTLVPNMLPQRLSNFDFFSGHQLVQESTNLEVMNDEDDEQDEEVAYDVISDDSEETVKPSALQSDPELAMILENLEEEPLSPQRFCLGLPANNHIVGAARNAGNRQSSSSETPVSQAKNEPPRQFSLAATRLSQSTHFVLPAWGLSSAAFVPTSHSPSAYSDSSNGRAIPSSPDINSIKNLGRLPPAPPPPLPSKQNKLFRQFQPPAIPPPSRLTIDNLRKLEAPASGTSIEAHRKKKGINRRKPPRLSAKVYMQDIWEAESSAATSVLSEGTRSKIGGGSLTAWQDKSHNFLGHYAKEGKAAAVRLLLEKNCNPGTKEKPRPGPLLSAVRGASPRHTKCVRVLLDFGANVNVTQSGTGKTSLHLAIEHRYFKGYRTLIYTLLDHGANPNIRDASGDVPLLQILYGGYEPLEKHKRDALALLLEQTHFTTDVNIMPPGTQNLPLHLAVRRKDPWAVGMLLEKEAMVNAPNGAGVTPFAMAASSWSETMTDEQKEVADHLLYHGADADIKVGSTGSTVLQIAITHGLVDMVEILQEYDADPEAKDNAGQTAFDIARRSIKSGKNSPEVHAKIMHMLFETLDIQIPVEASVCAFVAAVQKSDTAAATALLKYGADVNHRYGTEKYPVLHLAITQGDLDMVRLLIGHDALTKVSDCNYGYTFNATQCAQSSGHDSIEQYLKREGRQYH